jgi:anaerobic magnesium-protoporphyrin IX monomethyl ester cyclase
MFKNTYSPEFYKQLHHYIHKLYRRQKAEKRIRSMNRITDIKKLLAWPIYNMAAKKSFLKLRQTEPDVNISL